MLLAALTGIEKYYGEQVVLDDVTLELREGWRLALIGRNGSGKSTILKLLMGIETPDGGTVYRAEGVTLAMLEQDPEFPEGETVLAVAERAFAELDELDSQLKQLEAAGLDDHANYERWERLHATFERRGGYARRARRDAVLDALGFTGRYDQSVRQLSGGERTRLGLARLLMAQPDVLLLDEPTNHLDIDMRGWLENYLKRYPGAAIIVSHDRAFLDTSCGRTAEMSRGTLRGGEGNPTDFKAAMAEADRIQAATRANQERELQRLEASAEQMKRWAASSEKLAKRARGMVRRAERYEERMIDSVAGAERTTRFTFDCDPSGDIVLTARHITKTFEKELFEDVTVELRSGDRVALVGPNGAGKTTFLRMLLGQLASDDPRAGVNTGSRVRLGYYDQELRGVDPDATLFEELLKRVNNAEAHNLLGRFLFPYEAQFKLVRDLSGGERARLALLDLTLSRCNLLILDEPTNHLDLEMIEALEDALAVYQGTLVIVSHDRRFLEGLVTRVWEVRGGRFEEYEGDWEFYLRKRLVRGPLAGSTSLSTEKLAPAQGAGPRGTDPSTPSPLPAAGAVAGLTRWQMQKRLAVVEKEITTIEGELERVSAGLAAPAQAVTPSLLSALAISPARPNPTEAEIVAELGSRHASLESELLVLIDEWHQLTDHLVGER
jgi:ATP-binding cassette subfamily F protein 3